MLYNIFIIMTVIGTSCAHLAAEQAAPPQTREVLGLFIGVNLHPQAPEAGLAVEQTNRRVLVPLLEDHFAVRWVDVVSGERATREGVRDSMRKLYSEAQSAIEAKKDVTVLFFYTGHGARVRDQDGDEQQDGMDESLATVNSSSRRGFDDIRDDDLAAFRMAIARLGAEMVMLVEACHSETVHRGPPSLRLRRDVEASGSAQILFPEFGHHYEALRNHPGETASLVDGELESRFVILSAAQDEQLAFVDTDSDGTQWGRFSRALASTLTTMRPNSSYRELHAYIVREFDRRWPDDPQRPTLLTDGAERGTSIDHRDVPFLGGRLRTPHAKVVTRGDRVELDEGMATGYLVGAVVSVFASIESLEDGAEPITEARVTEAGFAWASIDARGDLPAGAVARIAVPAVPGAAVFVTECVSDELKAALIAVEESASIQFVDAFERAQFVLDQRADELALYAVAEAAPTGSGVPSGHSIWRGQTGELSNDQGAAVIAEEIDLTVRSRRFWSMLKQPDQALLRIALRDGDTAIRVENAVPNYEHGADVRLTIANNTAGGRFVSLFQSSEHEGVISPFRQIDIGNVYLEAGESMDIEGELAINYRDYSREVTRFKLLLTSEPVNLRSSLSRSSARAKTRSDIDSDPFRVMFERAMLNTRNGVRSNQIKWAASNTVIVITRPSKPG